MKSNKDPKGPKRERDEDEKIATKSSPARSSPASVDSSSTSTSAPRFIAEQGKYYPLSTIPAGADFKSGILKARCTSVEVKEMHTKDNTRDFVVLEIVVTDTVSRMVTGNFSSRSALPSTLPEVGDLVVISGVTPKAATYDAQLYGDVQFSKTAQFTIQRIRVLENDNRIPKEWSKVSVRVERPLAQPMTVEDFFKF